MTTTQAEAATSPESPATVPTLQDHAAKLAPLGWTGREAEWLALVALHSGVFTRSQWRHYFDDPRREMVSRFVRALVEKKLAFEDERPIFPDRARAVLLTGKPLYHALGIPDVRHRRSKDATTVVLTRRLLSLDYIIERPTFGWLPTEADKVRRFEALGLDRRTFPYRLYGPEGTPQTPRYFAFKLPIAVDDQAATFVYVDATKRPTVNSARGAPLTCLSGPRFVPGRSPCMSSPSAWAQTRPTAPRPCSNTGPRTATAPASTTPPGRPRPTRKSVRKSRA